MDKRHFFPKLSHSKDLCKLVNMSHSTLEHVRDLIENLGDKLQLMSQSDSVKETSDIHLNVSCDYCKISNFREYRYKCLTCNNYDLCGSCFEKRHVNMSHELSHPLVRFDLPGQLYGLQFTDADVNMSNFMQLFKNESHYLVKCDVCQTKPVRGLRFKCDACNDYNLCHKCFSSRLASHKHSVAHPVIVHGRNDTLQIDSGDIELIETIGTGGFGRVYKSKLKSMNKLVACKVIKVMNDKDKNAAGMNAEELVKSYMAEREAYEELRGVNILKMFAYCIEYVANGINLMLVTELMSKGSLTSLLANEPDLSHRRRLEIACDVASGLARIHEHMFLHRDIRPDNILIAGDYTAKIGDMGIAKVFNTTKNTMMGCLNYMPPEFFTGEFTQKSDVFMFGLSMNQLYEGTHTSTPPIQIVKMSPVFVSLIMRCVEKEAARRPSSPFVKELLVTCRKAINEVIFEKSPEVSRKYAAMSKQERNEFFKFISETVWKNIRDANNFSF